MKTKSRLAILLFGAAALLGAHAATAADMDAPIFVEDAADEYVPVEVGSGWYLRGDIGYDASDSYERIDRSEEYGGDVTPFFGSVGMGYHFNDYLRAELNSGILPSAKYTKNDAITSCFGYVNESNGFGSVVREAYHPCTQSSEVDLKAYEVMANGYIDLGTYSGLTPYIGAGIGAMYVNTSFATGKKNCNSDQVFECSEDPLYYEGKGDSRTTLEFAYALAAGVSYRVSKNLSVDLGYEYKSAPGATYYAISENQSVAEKKGLDFQTIKVGLRYDLW